MQHSSRFFLPQSSDTTSKAPSWLSSTMGDMPEVLSLCDVQIVQEFARKLKITYEFQTQYASIEKHCYLAKVDALKFSEQSLCYGVFVNCPIAAGVYVADYIGELKKEEELGSDLNFVFMLRQTNKKQTDITASDWYIDALKKRGMAAFVNSTQHHQSANVEAVLSGDSPENYKILYRTTRAIDRHEQLLIYYGRDYPFDKQYVRYLNPKHSYKNSKTFYDDHKNGYIDTSLRLDRSFTELFFNQLKDRSFMLPLHFSGDEARCIFVTDIDLPFLEKDETSDEFLSQYYCENITTLMLLCFCGTLPSIKKMLEKGADPYRCTNITGITPLHLLMANQILSKEDKLCLMKEWNKHKEVYTFLDSKGRSPLHWAITHNQPLEILQDCFKKMNEMFLQEEYSIDDDHQVSDLDHNHIFYQTPFLPQDGNQALLPYIMDQSNLAIKPHDLIRSLISFMDFEDYYYTLTDSISFQIITDDTDCWNLFLDSIKKDFCPPNMISRDIIRLNVIAEKLKSCDIPYNPVLHSGGDSEFLVLQDYYSCALQIILESPYIDTDKKPRSYRRSRTSEELSTSINKTKESESDDRSGDHVKKKKKTNTNQIMRSQEENTPFEKECFDRSLRRKTRIHLIPDDSPSGIAPSPLLLSSNQSLRKNTESFNHSKPTVAIKKQGKKKLLREKEPSKNKTITMQTQCRSQPVIFTRYQKYFQKKSTMQLRSAKS